MELQSLKSAWTTIDQSSDPAYFVRFMDSFGRQDEAPGQYTATFDLLELRDGCTVLDVGCGSGAAARVAALRVGSTGRAVGIDNSSTMIDEAHRRAREMYLPVECLVADARAMPFADETFDASYSLGVFELVQDPMQVLAEMVRVTRRGGRVLVTGPDADTWTVDAADREVTRAILHYACDHEWNGWIGRQLPAAFKGLGLGEISVTPSVGMTSNLALVNDLWLANHVACVRQADLVTTEALDRWLADLEQRQREGRFFSSITSFTVVGRKP